MDFVESYNFAVGYILLLRKFFRLCEILKVLLKKCDGYQEEKNVNHGTKPDRKPGKAWLHNKAEISILIGHKAS